MAFVIKENQLIDSGVTCLDNKFILTYVPDAPNKCVAVYLLGLALSDSCGTDNSCQTIAHKLGLTETEVMTAYLYWQEMGLVHITATDPQQIVYLSVRNSASALKKVNSAKYSKFSRELQNIMQGRMITPHEYSEYYTFLESTTFEQDALLAVAKYCVELRGNSISYQYILTVARNQLQRGATTLAVVGENLDRSQKYDEDLKLVFKALGLSRKFDIADRELYHKWFKEYGFSADVINSVAKECKGKGINKLDADLTEYYKKAAFSVDEIQSYKKQKESLTELAKQITRTIGVYYQNVSIVIDEYLVDWTSKGYDEETLLAIAKYCFRSGIRTLAGMATIVGKLYKKGITNHISLEAYFAAVSQTDAKIKIVLENAGIARKVTANDRMLYKVWTENWAMPTDTIEFVATKAAGTNTPMAYINRVLSSYKQQNIYTVAQAKAADNKTFAVAATTTKKVLIGGNDIERTEYTDEEINALFTSLDDTEE